jgi:integrase
MSIKIRRYKNGGWEADINVRLPNGIRHRERRKAPVSTKTQAKDWARERERHLLRKGCEQAPQPVMPTLAEFMPRFMVSYCEANRLKASTMAAKESIFRHHLGPSLGHLPLDQIDREAVQRLKAKLKSKAPKTVNNILTDLNTVLKTAFEWGVLLNPPPRIGFVKNPPKEMSYYTPAQYAALVAAAERVDPKVHAMVLLGGDAGLRRGEMMGLRLADVNHHDGLLHVRKAVWKGVVDSPKSGRTRHVPMTRRLAEALESIRHLRGERLLTHRERDHVTEKIIKMWMREAQRLAGLFANGGVHILRHTFCSHLAIKGANARSIQKLAGHADLNTTMRYMHLAEDDLRVAIRCLEDQKKQPPRGDILETGRLRLLKT